MSENDAHTTDCSNPIEAEVLSDYWLAALPSVEAEAVEEHLFACDGCARRLQHVIAMAEGIRNLAREGSLQIVVSDAFLRRAAEEGLRVRQYAPPRGGSVQCTVTAEDDILIGRLAVNLGRARRIDVSICDGSGVEQLRMRDIPANPNVGEVILQESITFIKDAPTTTMIVRLVDVDDAGGERLLGEYTFNHTRSMPGPAAW